jgi:hypothetical protein
MGKVSNTTAQVQADPMLGMDVALGGIEAQEARGQRELVNTDSLPTECDNRQALEAHGVKFGEPYKDDPLFCDAILPTGWRKRATDHSMHSDLIDDKGRVRAWIFYKAAYYDRRADMHVIRRYTVDMYADGSDDKHTRVVAKDGGNVIHVFGEAIGYDDRAELGKGAEKWLDQQFPEWRNAAAYWDSNA